MVKQLAILFVWIFAVTGAAHAQTDDVPFYEGELKVSADFSNGPPYVGEMVLLSVEGFYPSNISLEKLVFPEFNGVSWSELGEDDWFEVNEGGRVGKGFIRNVAVFAGRSGDVTIAPFVHEITFVTSKGGRVKQKFLSAPYTFSVVDRPADSGDWIAAIDVNIEDSWDIDPESLEPGEAAVRRIKLSAMGLVPEELPSAPGMKAPGLMTFYDGEERSMAITPDGPVAFVTWQWTLRPISSTPVMLDPVTIKWFDTAKRRFENVVIAPQRIAVFDADTFGKRDFVGQKPVQKYATLIGLFVGLALGFLLTGSMIWTRIRWQKNR